MFQKSSDCTGSWETWCSWGGTDHVAGAKCFEAGDGRVFRKYVEGENCTETGGSGGPSGGGGGGGGGGGSGDDPDTVLTSPTYPDGSSAAPAFLVNILSPITLRQKRWIEDQHNLDAVEKILNYVSLNGSSTKAKEFAVGIIDFSNENRYSQYAADLTEEMIEAGLNETLISVSPFFQYPKGSNYVTQYPKLTEYLMNQLPSVADMPVITDAIQDITGLPLAEIQKDLQWGKGPTIKIVQLDDYSEETDVNTTGAFDKNSPDILLLDIDYVNALENGTDEQYQEDGLLFYLGMVILHEYVHYGDNTDGTDYPGEEGEIFELKVYGGDLTPGDAIWIILQKYY